MNFKLHSMRLFYFFIVVIFIFSIYVRIPKPEENWNNSDATYHILLTINAYEKTPVKEHLFLPIVSLGEKEDKSIQWGATVPDKNGNYYYTSFGALGFVFPYTLLKLSKLAMNETTLYLANSFLFFITCLSLTILFTIAFKNKISTYIIVIITSLIFLFSPETMHSYGIVYWHHSFWMLIFIWQTISFYKWRLEGLKHSSEIIWGVIFIFLSFISPLIEWSGFVANLGFVLTIFLYNKRFFSRKYLDSFILLLSTFISFVVLCFHYLLRIDFNTFLLALKMRFLARSVSKGNLIDLLNGYLVSFGYFQIIILFFLIVMLFLLYRKKLISQNLKKMIYSNLSCTALYKSKLTILLLVLCFPLLENIIMLQHAISYSFDRLKLFPIVIFGNLIIISLLFKLLEREREREREGYVYYNNPRLFSIVV